MNFEQQALVSIGVPTYNRPKTLKRAIESLISQTYQNIEIIVSDNCSTNSDVQNVMNEFADDLRVKFIQQPVNKGPVFNFNFVLFKASGDYFMWLADDDWLDLNYIENCVNFLAKNPEYAASYGAAKMYTQDGTFINYDTKIDLIQNSGSERVEYFLQHLLFNGCFSAIIRKKFKPELLMKDVIAIDWLIVMRIGFLGKFKMLETTNKHISQGGLSASIESLTKNMPEFTKSFPSLTIAINLVVDVMSSSAYRKAGFFNRVALARRSFFIVYNKHNVKTQIGPGIKKYMIYKKNYIKMILKRLVGRKSVSI